MDAGEDLPARMGRTESDGRRDCGDQTGEGHGGSPTGIPVAQGYTCTRIEQKGASREIMVA